MLYGVCTQDIAAVVFLCYGFASVNRHTLYILEFNDQSVTKVKGNSCGSHRKYQEIPIIF